MGALNEREVGIVNNSVSREQIARAKEIGIEDYILSHESDNVKRVGGAYYLRDHNSLEISNNLWNWHSHGIGGKNVIDYLIFVRGYSFVDAVRKLTGEEIAYTLTVPQKARPPTPERISKPRTPLKLPRRNKDNLRAIAYLRSRGIDKDLIQACIRQGNLYESAEWHNAVFIGRDERGKVRFAAIRGTTGSFKRDADESEKRFGFIILPVNSSSRAVMVFEAPIDALSHQTLYPDFDGYRLSLGGTATVALTTFLEHHKEITNVVVATDNDEAGEMSAAKIREIPNIDVSRSYPPNCCNDWNEGLLAIQKAERTQNHTKSAERS
jgi:hypothetical protein